MNLSPTRASRNGCAFHGALQTLLAIPGTVPIIHSSAGCGFQHYLGTLEQGSGGCGGAALPSTNVLERQIIFGGGSRLREQIKNAVKVVEGELYAVLTGCAAEMVGDDVPALVRETRDQGGAIVGVHSPGFRGTAQLGYQACLASLLKESATSAAGEKTPGTVNLLGVLPGRDPFWEGNLTELRRLLASVGLKANPLFGWDASPGALRELHRAEASLVLSPWGLPAAEYLRDQAGVPVVDLGYLPVGARETGVMLSRLGEALGLDPAVITAVLAREQRREAHYLEKIADAYFDRGFQRSFSVVGESGLVCGVVRFLAGTLGLIPASVVITDHPPEEVRPRLEEILRRDGPCPEAIVYAEDQGEIGTHLVETGAELVLGSALEAEAAAALKAPLVQVSSPVADRAILAGCSAGIDGGLRLVEELSRALF